MVRTTPCAVLIRSTGRGFTFEPCGSRGNRITFGFIKVSNLRAAPLGLRVLDPGPLNQKQIFGTETDFCECPIVAHQPFTDPCPGHVSQNPLMNSPEHLPYISFRRLALKLPDP